MQQGRPPLGGHRLAWRVWLLPAVLREPWHVHPLRDSVWGVGGGLRVEVRGYKGGDCSTRVVFVVQGVVVFATPQPQTTTHTADNPATASAAIAAARSAARATAASIARSAAADALGLSVGATGSAFSFSLATSAAADDNEGAPTVPLEGPAPGAVATPVVGACVVGCCSSSSSERNARWSSSSLLLMAPYSLAAAWGGVYWGWLGVVLGVEGVGCRG